MQEARQQIEQSFSGQRMVSHQKHPLGDRLNWCTHSVHMLERTLWFLALDSMLAVTKSKYKTL